MALYSTPNAKLIKLAEGRTFNSRAAVGGGGKGPILWNRLNLTFDWFMHTVVASATLLRGPFVYGGRLRKCR